MVAPVRSTAEKICRFVARLPSKAEPPFVLGELKFSAAKSVHVWALVASAFVSAALET